jgi:hypothetical protein
VYREYSVYCLHVYVGSMTLSFAAPDWIAAACNGSGADESVLYFGHAALFDLLPRTETLQIWWVGMVEPGGFANQIARRPRCPHDRRIRVPLNRPRTRHGRSWCKTRTAHDQINVKLQDFLCASVVGTATTKAHRTS